MAELHDEVWKDIIGFEGLYQVSNMGRVKSTSKCCRNQRKTAGNFFWQYA